MRPCLAIPAVLAALCLAPAMARDGSQWDGQPPEVRAWYSRAELTEAAQKRIGYKSCCAHADVVRTRFRVNKTDAQDEWDWLDGATWRRIPPDIIHFDRHAPDGRPTLFVIGANPVCFFTPEGGI